MKVLALVGYFFKTATLIVEALVTARYKYVHPRCIKRVSMLRQPRGGARLTSSSQVSNIVTSATSRRENK
jgi:hypothetical protein